MAASELHVITLCALIIAAEPAKKLWIQFKNWRDAERRHQQWLIDQQR